MTDTLAARILHAEAAVTDKLREQEKRNASHRDSSHKRTWETLGLVYAIGSELTLVKNAGVFSEALAAKGLSQPSAGDNLWTHVLGLICGYYQTDKDTGGKSWVSNRTYKNYGRALRGLAFLVVAADAIKAAQAINDFNHEKHGKHIDGLKKLDLANNPITGVAIDASCIKRADELSALDFDADENRVSVEDKFALVWCKVHSGKLVPMGIIANSAKAAEKEAVKQGRLLLGDDQRDALPVVDHRAAFEAAIAEHAA